MLQETENMRLKGRVIWFNNDKGFGFAVPDVAAIDVLIERKVIFGGKSLEIKQNQRIEMLLGQDDNGGFHAKELTVLEYDDV